MCACMKRERTGTIHRKSSAGSKTSVGAETHTREHKNLTNQPQNQPHPPTHAPDHTRTPGRMPACVATHHTTHQIKRGGGDGDGDGAQTWEQRGREPDGIGDGTPPRISGFGIRERLITL